MYRGIRRTMKKNRTRPEPAVKEIQNSEKNEGCRTEHSREYAPIYTGFSRFFAVLLLVIFVSVILLNPEDPAFAPGRSLLTMTGMAELLKTGCTTCLDHHYVFPEGTSGVSLLSQQFRAADELGMQ